MKKSNEFQSGIAVVSIVILMVIATYFWYRGFQEDWFKPVINPHYENFRYICENVFSGAIITKMDAGLRNLPTPRTEFSDYCFKDGRVIDRDVEDYIFELRKTAVK